MNNGVRTAGRRRTQTQRIAARLRAWLQPQISIGAREQRNQAILLLAVAVVIIPHFGHLPVWTVVAIGAMWIWRAWLTQSLNPGPGRLVMTFFLLSITLAVWLEYGTLIGRDAGVTFLLLLIGLKVLEMRAQRDVLVIVFLSLFVLQTQFLYDEGPVTAVLMVSTVALLFFVLLSVNLVEGDISFAGKLRYLARAFLLALPFTLALFFLFPRLAAPLWRSGDVAAQSGTGLSDSMTPGAISQLLRNDAIALRARFDQAPPAQRNLYWRGPVLGHFDGRTWTILRAPAVLAGSDVDVRFDPTSRTDYTVTLEPTQRHDLLALEFAAAVDALATEHPRLTPTLELESATPVSSRRRYRVRSYTSYVAGRNADPATLAAWLQLPDTYNPRTQQWAADLKARIATGPAATSAAGNAALDRRLVDAVLAHFHNEPFRYNISAPLLGRDTVDDFLFRTRVGYCEHYASSFVVIMRVMGIPARVVTGYQGGEINPVDGYLTVRQSDAHAWAEVWLEDFGWSRIDPTAAVAPDRVESTLQERKAEDTGAIMVQWTWLRQLRLDREAVENAWNQWFLSYSAERQQALIASMGLKPSVENLLAVAVVVFAFLLVVMTVLSLRYRVTRDPLAALVAQLRSKLARAGIEVAPTMGLRDLGQYLESRLDPQCLSALRRLLSELSAARYARPAPQAQGARIRALRSAVRQWRPVRSAPR